MIRFAHPEYLYALFVLPLLAALFWLVWWWGRRTLRRYGRTDTLLSMVHGRSRVKYWLRAGVWLLAVAALIVAWANPRIGTKYEEVTRSGIDLIVALDVSNSMLAQDITPSRIVMAKRELTSLIGNLKGDRIGIIVFSGDAYTQLPLTSDYSAATMLTDVIDVGSAPKPGTAIGSAIALARESFKNDEGRYKAMVIITDGENHEDDPIAEAKESADAGVVIHTIGMGSPEGAPIPVMRNGQVSGFKSDESGQTVLTRLDESALVQIASTTGGSFTRAANGRDNLAAVFDGIERMEKKEFGTRQFTDFEDRFQYLIALAIVLFIFELLISETRNRFLSRFSIFAAGPREQW